MANRLHTETSMRKATAVTLCALALATLTGCDTLRQTLNIQNPTFILRGIQPRVALAVPFSQSSIDFDFDIEVQNPNTVGLRLDRIDFDLLVNGNQITRGFSSDRIQIPANGFGDVRIRTRVGYDDIRSLFREVVDMVEGRRANYELRGRAFFNTPIGTMDFPLTLYRAGSDR